MKTLFTRLAFATVMGMALLPAVSAFASDADMMADKTVWWDDNFFYRKTVFPNRGYDVIGMRDGADRTNVVIPETKFDTIQGVDLPVLNIAAYAFDGETGIKTLSIPSKVRTIGNGAFRNTSIETVKIPGNVESIGDSCFSGSPVRDVYIYAPTEERYDKSTSLTMGDYAFDTSPADNFKDVYITYADAPAISDKVFTHANVANLHMLPTLTDDQENAYVNGTGWKEFFRKVPTGVDDVAVDENGDTVAEYYTINGAHVATVGHDGFGAQLTPGMYIVREGSHTYKTIVI